MTIHATRRRKAIAAIQTGPLAIPRQSRKSPVELSEELAGAFSMGALICKRAGLPDQPNSALLHRIHRVSVQCENLVGGPYDSGNDYGHFYSSARSDQPVGHRFRLGSDVWLLQREKAGSLDHCFPRHY